MKHLAGLVLCLSCAMAQVPNAGFEDGDQTPTGWAFDLGEDAAGESARVTAPVHSGRYAFRVNHQDALGYTRLAGGFVPVEAGKTYLVTAWVYPRKPVKRGVYFMLSQYPVGATAEQLPNTFGSTFRALEPERWQQLAATVEIREGNDRLRVFCIQAFTPSDIVWDDFAVVEGDKLPDAEPPRYEPPVNEPLPELAPAQAIVAQRPRAVVKVEQTGGRPRLFVDGKATPWAWYVGPFWSPNNAHIADFREAGERVYLVPLVLGRGVYADRGPWLGAGQYDFSEVDELLWRVLRVDPHGYVVFYMCCDPYREWGVEHPDDVTRDQHGQQAIVDMHAKRWGDDPKQGERFGPSLVSQRYRDEAAETLRRLVAHVEASEPGKAVIGYHVAGMNDGQWFQWAGFSPQDLHLADFSPAAQASFREWLSRRYDHDVRKLQHAWGRQVTFETAEIPPGDRVWADDVLLDPRTQTDLADSTRFYSEGPAETVIGLAGVIKQASPRRVLCGTYYEDITCNSTNHIALRQMLTSEAIDFLAGPAAYAIRMAGYPGAVRTVFGSTLLHGKTYLTEQDWRSYKSSPSTPANNFSWGRAETAEIHNAMVRRECGMMLAFGLGTWWYDMSGGWFADPPIMKGIAEAMRAFQQDLEVVETPTADLAVFVSEDSNHWLGFQAGGWYRFNGIRQQIPELNTSGVPYRLYLLEDLGQTPLPEHKAYLFLNAYKLGEPQRQAIEDLKRDGHTLIFVHAPDAVGAADPAQAIGKLTGLTVEPVELERRTTRALDGDHPLLQNLPAGLNYAAVPRGPVFAVTDPQATPLGQWVRTEQVAVAARDFGSWRSVYVGSPCLTAEFVANLGRWSGCWCAAPPGDAVYGNAHFLTIHALSTGPKQLTLQRPGKVVDLTSGATIAERTGTLEFTMDRATTRWFVVTPEEDR